MPDKRDHWLLRPYSPQARSIGRALEALGLMRREHRSLESAAREVGTTPRTVKKYAGSALRHQGARVVARPSDRLTRVMRALTTEGLRDLVVRGSREASMVGVHEHAVRRFLESGFDARLRDWRRAYGDKQFQGLDGGTYVLETDPDVIEDLDQVGEISYEDIYPDVT